jgi:hypothetical protein
MTSILKFIRGKLFRGSGRLPFNCDDQNPPNWIKRAEVAVELICSIAPQTDSFRISDIGCGDMKLKVMIEGRLPNAIYSGYDLIPQSKHVQKLDVEADPIPPCDMVVMLGVGEYLFAPQNVFSKTSECCKWLVVSHTINNYFKRSASEQLKLAWKNHLSDQQFSGFIESSGFRIVEKRLVGSGRAMIWLCQSTRFHD